MPNLDNFGINWRKTLRKFYKGAILRNIPVKNPPGEALGGDCLCCGKLLFSNVTKEHVIANQFANWCGNPLRF